MKLDFENEPPENNNLYEQPFSKEQEKSVETELETLFSKGIKKCVHKISEYVSQIFVQLKPDGFNRLIQNLKKLNCEMPYILFQTETLQSISELITPGCFMTSLDLKHAYYSIPINPDHTKYLRFFWKGRLHKFRVLPNDLCLRPRKFTKLMNPPVVSMRINGYIVAIYIDDLINIGLKFQECFDNIMASTELLDSLDFIIDLSKSFFIPK